MLSLCCGPPDYLAAQVTDKKASPEIQVAGLLEHKTAFPDSLYVFVDWTNFEKVEFFRADLDLQQVDYNLLNAGVFYYSNQYRTSKNLEPFIFSPALRDASQIHSIEMINRGFFDHVHSRNRHLRTPVDRARYFNYPNDYVGENIAIESVLENYTYGSNGEKIDFRSYLEISKSIVDGWIKSKPHRKNLLDKNYKYLGCGIAIDRTTISKNKLPEAYATQSFGQ